ncbi:MAG: AAA family ATPase [Pseudomonadota bacterium]
MILEGNARGYGAELAHHLLNPRDNDHVTVHAVEGFLADDLLGAFQEAEAISGATQCQKYLFSLSLNPPSAANVSVASFEAAITAAEAKLGLTGQPRAIVFHEKNGRRHAHCVWSRIDAASMRAVALPHFKRKLCDVSRELYRDHDWEVPAGFRDAAERDPTNYSRQEAGQAKRLKRDPKALKAMFRQCWEGSDSRAAFAAALEEQGYRLARGERRGFVAVDADGKVWSLSRWCGVKPKALRAKLGPEEALPSLDDVLAGAHELRRPRKQRPDPLLEHRRVELIARQRQERDALIATQEARRIDEVKARRRALPRGFRAAFLRMTGQYRRHLSHCEREAERSKQRDRDEQHQLIQRHLSERRALRRNLRRKGVREDFNAEASVDARQRFIAPADGLDLTRDQLLANPALILAHLSKTEASFTRTQVLRALAKRIDDPFALKDAADRAMKAPELVRVGEDSPPTYTTRDYQAAAERMQRSAASLGATGGFRVSRSHIESATRAQDAQMQRAFGGRLSEEQRDALTDILGDSRFACVVGLAGAGKSTMLAIAKEAWSRQGVTVHGAALAGKAADGLESASGIQSRTLASLEASWENGHEPIAKGDVLVIDEAGMIGTRQLARVAEKIEAIGAKLVLVGDPDQLQPIDAGTPFRTLIAEHGAASLTEIHRQREDWQRQASRALAAGRVAEATAIYARQNAVIDREDAVEALVESYAMDVAANGAETTRLAFAHRRKDVHALNQAIRAALRPPDEPGSEVLFDTETGPRAFAPGDRIVFNRNDRELGVKNGTLGTVERAETSRLVVRLDGEPPHQISVDPRHYRHFDHGYAVTIHKSQGATVDHAYVLASRSMDRHLAYVAMTRHRDAMRLFVRSDDRPDWARQYRHRAFERDPPQRSGPSMG